MKTRTLLVDSSFLLKRSFDGAKDMYTNSFGHIGGLYGFYMKLRSLIKNNLITKVVLCWDGENGGKQRYLIEKTYKANRKNKSWHEKIELSEKEYQLELIKEQSLLKQRVRIQQYAEELFLRQIEVDEIEADDIIAKYCIEYSKKEDIFIYTNDRDFLMLLDYNITILIDNIDTPITKDNFFIYFPYHYKNALTYKILCGDPADNIKGIKGLGIKTIVEHAKDFKFRYYTVKEICQIAKKVNENRIKEKKKPLKVFSTLLSNIEKLKINHKLMNLHEPFLSDDAINEIENQTHPLSEENRGSKILYKYLMEDGIFEHYKGNFQNYVEPFYNIIMKEKEFLKKNKK